MSINQEPVATVDDYAPLDNIAPFGMCESLANPAVAAATAAALGVLTPQPCIPNTTAPWTPGSTFVTIDGVPLLEADNTCACMWAGVITITDPGQEQVTNVG